MRLFSLRQDRALVRADFAFYGLAVAASAAALPILLPAGQAAHAAAWAGAGLGGWTLAEYLLHRYVLHGLQPFKRWHALHHAHPRALIATPTLLTAAMFALLVAAPAGYLLAPWRATGLMLGVMAGYLVYIVMHHAMHHMPGRAAWLRRHRRRHALHHAHGGACYGVSVGLWDHVFGSAAPPPPGQPR